MSESLTLADIDVDGAIRETAAEAMDALDGDTRSQFLRRAGVAGGAFMGGSALLGALAPSALAAGAKKYDRPPSSFGKGDIGILNYALTLEYLESSFYNEATANQRKNAWIPNNEVRTRVFLSAVTQDENAHVKALKSVLGSKAVRKPKFNFGNTTNSYKPFVDTSFVLENTGVSAYSGQATNIKEAAVAEAAVSIVTVEARHASVIGLIRNSSDYGITPNGAFDKALGAGAVLKAVKGTGFIVG